MNFRKIYESCLRESCFGLRLEIKKGTGEIVDAKISSRPHKGTEVPVDMGGDVKVQTLYFNTKKEAIAFCKQHYPEFQV
jgi:hypothetical protein